MFKIPGACKTAEEAEDAVAQLALMKLITVAFVKTRTSVGERHNLTFFSSVEIEGKIFHGDGAKSKKQAEENAAKVAYIALTKCKSFHAAEPSTVSLDLEGKVVKTEPIMDSLSISVGQEKFKDEKVNASSISHGVQELSVNEKSPSGVTPSKSSIVSKANSSVRMTAETTSYLLSNRIR
ncbi:hypothetical protein K7X08_026226 [Anisodus acutangulus]|uniref:DRBM domain-containing protein n=1 Tax=Anisodus acutangulus TaxID=402998 RepID=A0A9Q1N3S4_9SOLA|nr:hypothetical protein K7X08_026226 [Anisodus acutangulus]